MTEPYRYQRKGVRKLHHFGGRALLADDMGLGKSFQTLLYANELGKRARPTIVVCPAILKDSWEREAATHLGQRAAVLYGRKPPRGAARMLQRQSLIIINYDILIPQRGKDWLELLLGLDPGLVVLDECQALQNRDSKRTKACRALCQDVDRVVALSGTPLMSKPIEMWPTLNILRPDIYNSYHSFGQRFCQPRRMPWGEWQYKGATNLDELHNELSTYCMIRRRKDQVLKDLPPKTRTVVPLELTNRREYDTALNDFLYWLEKNYSSSKARRAAKAERLVKAGYLKRLAAQLKYQYVVQWIEQFLQQTDEKLVAYGYHKKFLKPIHQHFKGCSVLVDGTTSVKQRKAALHKFANNRSTRIFFGQLRAAGMGLNELKVASTWAAMELDWVPAIMLQAEDRLHRIGQQNAVMCYYLIAKDTIEEHLCKLLQEKQGTIEATLDGKEIADLDIFNKLMEMLKQ